MTINLCPVCMRETEQPCPYCGFDTRMRRQQEGAIRYFAILNGRYAVGHVLNDIERWIHLTITYVGYDLALNERVVIQEYSPMCDDSREADGLGLKWGKDEDAKEFKDIIPEFLNEARKMEALSDLDGIVRVRDVFEENSTAYIVMDYIEGEMLSARIRRTGRPLTWAEAQKIFFPIISAMAKVHAAGVIHEKIYPDSLILMPEGGGKLLGIDAVKYRKDRNFICPGFSPIEMDSRYNDDVSGKYTYVTGTYTDVYTMGATLYYALTGTEPRIYGDKLDMSRREIRALPRAAREALKNALAVRASERTQTMDELLAGLKGEATSTSTRGQEQSKTSRKWNISSALFGTRNKDKEKADNADASSAMRTEAIQTQPQKSAVPATPARPSSMSAARSEATKKPAVSATPASNFKYMKNNNGITITGLTDKEEKLIHISIPTEIDGLKVTSIGDNAFKDCYFLTRIEIPDCVTSIGMGAFYNCVSLASIHMPDSIMSIGAFAFALCKSLTTIKVPKSVTKIRTNVFTGCMSLASIVIPDNVTAISSDAFDFCAFLKLVSLPAHLNTEQIRRCFPSNTELLFRS